MAQKKYQQLSSENHMAAREIWEALKKEKALSQENFEIIYASARGISYGGRKSGSFHNLYKTTRKFLLDHNLMTYNMINGLIVYVATQKCFRCKTFENATKEVQEVTNSDIDKAIQYVTLNNGKVPAEYEAPVVANILGLEGNHWKYFVRTYCYGAEGGIPWNFPIHYRVISAVQILDHERLIAKV